MSLLSDIINNTEGLYHGDLKYYFKCLFNSRGANNPFHGIRHSCDVFIKCHDAIKYYIEAGRPTDLWTNRALLISALFHDFNHPGRAGNDDLNLQFAIRALKKSVLPEDDRIIDVASKYISLTEFGPDGHVWPAYTIEAQILRDADISQVCSQAWIRLVLFGLSAEMGLSPEQMLKMQSEFLGKVSFETEWARVRFGNAIKEKIAEAEELVKILS